MGVMEILLLLGLISGGAYGFESLRQSGKMKAHEREIGKSSMKLQEKQMIGQQEAAIRIGKQKERMTDKQMRELRAVGRRREMIELEKHRATSEKEQGIADQMMLNQMIQAMMELGKQGGTSAQRPGLPPATILSMMRGY